MANLNGEGVFIQVRYAKEGYSTALYYTPDEFGALDERTLEDEKERRFTEWQAFVAEQSNKPPVVLSDAELEEAKVQLQEKKAELDKQIAEIDVELSK